MAVPPEELQEEQSTSKSSIPNNGFEDRPEVEEEERDEEDDDGDEEEDEPQTPESELSSDREKMAKLANRLRSEPVTLRVHDVIIKGNAKTKDSVIEAEIIDDLKRASTLQEIFQAAGIGTVRLRQLDIFDSVSFMVDAGPKELPGTANVVVEIVETKSPLTGEIGMYTKPGVINFCLCFVLINHLIVLIILLSYTNVFVKKKNLAW